MTIKLAYIAERDGLVFLCDKEGKELWQVVPVDSTAKIIHAALHAPAYGHPETATPGYHDVYKAMLSAAKVDVSAALVKVPARKPESRDYYNCNDEWNACLDELERS